MSRQSHELLRLASMIAAGAITQHEVSKLLGDDSMMDEVMGLVAGIGAGTVVAIAFETAYETPIIGDAMELGEDIIDAGLDLFGF